MNRELGEEGTQHGGNSLWCCTQGISVIKMLMCLSCIIRLIFLNTSFFKAQSKNATSKNASDYMLKFKLILKI
jgi:hypothetical protein